MEKRISEQDKLKRTLELEFSKLDRTSHNRVINASGQGIIGKTVDLHEFYDLQGWSQTGTATIKFGNTKDSFTIQGYSAGSSGYTQVIYPYDTRPISMYGRFELALNTNVYITPDTNIPSCTISIYRQEYTGGVWSTVETRSKTYAMGARTDSSFTIALDPDYFAVSCPTLATTQRIVISFLVNNNQTEIANLRDIWVGAKASEVKVANDDSSNMFYNMTTLQLAELITSCKVLKAGDMALHAITNSLYSYSGSAWIAITPTSHTHAHNDMTSKQGGTTNEYYHLTSAEYAGSGTGVFARVTSPVFTTPNIGAATATTINGAYIGKGLGTTTGTVIVSAGAPAGNTTGQDNSFFGNSAGNAITEGIQNAFFGRGSGRVVTTGDYNTACGAYSLDGIVVGDNNTAIGSYSGRNPVGSNNVFLGYNTGSGMTNGDANTIIGANYAGVAGSNQVVIADGAGTKRFESTSAGLIALGGATPEYTVTLENSMGRIVGVQTSATDVTGKAITIQGGSCIAGTSVDNVGGGVVSIKPGVGTGTNYGQVYIFASTPGVSGKVLNTNALMVTIDYKGIKQEGLTASHGVFTDAYGYLSSTGVLDMVHGGTGSSTGVNLCPTPPEQNGAMIYSTHASPGAWASLSANTTTTKKHLSMTGTGTDGAAPVWDDLSLIYLPLDGTRAMTGMLALRAGTAAAGTAPLKFQAGPLLTTPEAGAIEFTGDVYYATIITGSARKTFAFLESPSFTTPNIGASTATTINGLEIGATTGGALTIGNSLTLTLNTGGVTLTGNAAGSTLVLPSGSTALGTICTQAANNVAITGGSVTGLTGLAIRDTSAAYDVTIAGTSSTALTTGRTLTIDMVNAARTLKLSGNTALNQELLTTSNVQHAKLGLGAAAPTYCTMAINNDVSAPGNAALLGISAVTTQGLPTTSSYGQLYLFTPKNNVAINTGGVISFGASYDATYDTIMASIFGGRENATNPNTAGYLAFYTRDAAGTLAIRQTINSTGVVNIPNLTASRVVLTDASSNLTTQSYLAGTKVYYVSDSSGGTVNRKLTFTNGILTAET